MRAHALFAICVAFGCPDAGAQDAVSNSRGPAPGPAVEQNDAVAQPGTLETITVTGTHIRGVDSETEHPLQVLRKEDMTRTGLTDTADVVQSLLVANGASQNRNINNGNDGRELVNLRSLGPDRTLVLINGQRWVSAVDGAVDLSAVPLSLVERIEVLKDGASAVYGSDAIAGVINIVTRRDFTGTELGLYAGGTDHGDGLRREADFSFGRGGNR